VKNVRTVAGLVVAVGLAAAIYGWVETGRIRPAESRPSSAGEGAPVVDQAPLVTAQRLRAYAGTAEEQRIAGEAVDAAGHLLDIAFADALRDATQHPPPLTPAAQKIQSRLHQVADRMVADNAAVVRLTAAVSAATGDKKDALQGELDLAQAQFEVDQDEYHELGADLLEAGGDVVGRIRQMVADHEAAMQVKVQPAAPSASPASIGSGLIALVEHWWMLKEKARDIFDARYVSANAVASIDAARAALLRQLEAGAASPAGTAPTSLEPRSREESAALLAQTQRVAESRKTLASLDGRRAAQAKLTDLYDRWLAMVTPDTESALHRALVGVISILLIGLLLLFFDGWLVAALGRLRLARRQFETLRGVISVALEVLAVLAALLIILGPPRQLGTFLGLAGAGLTVALKDFIVAFFGWFVLMGKNGIRLGDWVEINGVAGEVVELGMFRTVLLETGNWTDSGHPTGRRVTFTNGYAIEGHYFNFSTSGQWLWDALQLVVPTGQDPYPVVEAISRVVAAATADNARLAEEEWRRAVPTRELSGLTGAPAINIKPVVGGTELSVRYITRAGERYRQRAQLYEEAVKLLGPKPAPVMAPAASS